MTNRLRSSRRALLLASLLAAVSVPAASAAPTTVELRVEGPTQTIFEGPITTDGHAVTTAAGGTHACDGSQIPENNGAGPTATSALDDAAGLKGFTWDGAFDSGFGDFLISRVAGDTVDSSHYWALYLNSGFANYGGCGQRVAAGNEVLWAYSDFATSQTLRLTGPATTHPGQPITVAVTNGPAGIPQAGAKVGAAVTGADGRAAVSFAAPGIYRLKAERADSIRSNALSVCVDAADADPCTSGDKTAPVASVNLPEGVATANFRSRTIVISWQAQDSAADGSGVATYTAEAREVSGGASASQDQPWRTLVWRSKDTSVPFRGHAGKSYEFRVTAYDRAANPSVPATGVVSFPVDDRNRRILRLSKGWRGVKRAEAYGGRVVQPRKAGASARMRFTGTSVALVGRTLPKGGRLAVSVGGKRTVLKLRGSSGYRQTLWTSPKLKPGAHVLRIEALGGGPVELDAVAPLP
jgi:hypothetical protein